MSGSVRNELSGTVHGPSVQAGQIFGGITFRLAERAPVARPDEVPAPTVRCVNHERELALLGTGAGARVGLDVLSGLPGVGKTTLAGEWAARVRDRFPGGQLYIDFAELDGDAHEALGRALRSLGVEEDYLPASLEERRNRFRSCTAGRCLLVVLDNVSLPAQVRVLLPKEPGSAVLAIGTGRLGELVLDGARLVPVPPLDAESGLALLADRCGEAAVAAEREAAERLVGLCGGLPEALAVVAARLAVEPGLTMGRLAGELADETRRLTGLSLREERSVSAVLSIAYRGLPPDAARAYRLWGLIPGRTFDAGTAAAAAGVGVAEAEALLRALAGASLLDAAGDGRHRFHDLVRLHARERAEDEEPEPVRRAVVERVTTHYLALTAFADLAVRRDRLRIAELDAFLRDVADPFAGDAGPSPLAWLDAERHNILAVLRQARRDGLHRHVWQLAEVFTVLFLNRRHLSEWRESLELGAASAADAFVPAAEARLRSLLSRPLMDLEAYERAREELEKAEACAEVSGHTVLRASVAEFGGRYWDRFDPPRAIAAYRRSVELNLEAGEPRGVAIATYFLGCAQDAAGRTDEALRTLRAAREGLSGLAVPDRRMAARATAALGDAYGHAGDSAAAVAAWTEAAGELEAVGAAYYEARVRLRLARALEDAGVAPGAVLPHVARALEIHEAGGSGEAGELRAWARRLGV
ncbi:hypothetical protein [Streptomyces caatingaensis]|uniref:NB-ARC domain-containing protein n=1 Tax=Streptomyces caatingaensis TaxID=1678637 RepID=A0A0K9XMV8_9ACTN|nr:hypothetical protein [Streptomyces caatingaensis]KNB54441.1 hypothetical protein AC230_00780 [Streptomyces caatingaensis]